MPPKGAAMKVCMLAGNPLVFDGRAIRHAVTLAESGHDVRLLGVLGPNDPWAELPDLAEIGAAAGGRLCAERLDRRRDAGVLPGALWLLGALRRRAARIGVELLGPRRPLAELLVAPWAVDLALRAAASGADVFHANDLDTLVPAAWAARLLGRPYVYDAHELYTDESPGLPVTERTARLRVEAELLRGAAAVLTVNDLLADELLRLYGGARPEVVRNVPRLVPMPPVPARDPAAPLRLLMQGSWVGLEQPGIDAALQAVAAVPAARLILRGGVRDESALRARCAELGVTARVELRPRLPGPEALIAAALCEGHDVGLSVHLPDCASRRLATSSKVFEYLMAGLAVLAAEQPGNRHLLGDDGAKDAAGLYFRPGDAADLADKLRRLSGEPERLARMQAAARRRAEKELCWEREAPRLTGIYDRIAGR